MNTITRKQAIELGLNRYFTGRPCRNGHVSERRAHSHNCIACEEEHRRKHRQTDCYEKTRRSRYVKMKTNDPARFLYDGARGRAIKYHLPFTITVDDIRDVWPKDNKCPVLGYELTVSVNTEGGYNQGRRQSPSLDRIIPEMGYVPGNIIVISLRANQIKSDATAEEVTKVAEWMNALTDARGNAGAYLNMMAEWQRTKEAARVPDAVL